MRNGYHVANGKRTAQVPRKKSIQDRSNKLVTAITPVGVSSRWDCGRSHVMRTISFVAIVVLMLYSTFTPLRSFAQNASYTPDQLDQLVAPIALYPDAL